MNNTNWVFLHSATVEKMVTADLDGNGKDEVILSVDNHGTWIRWNNSNWSKLHDLRSKDVVVTKIKRFAPKKIKPFAPKKIKPFASKKMRPFASKKMRRFIPKKMKRFAPKKIRTTINTALQENSL